MLWLTYSLRVILCLIYIQRADLHLNMWRWKPLNNCYGKYPMQAWNNRQEPTLLKSSGVLMVLIGCGGSQPVIHDLRHWALSFSDKHLPRATLNFCEQCSNNIVKHQLKGNATLMWQPPTHPSRSHSAAKNIPQCFWFQSKYLLKSDLTFIFEHSIKDWQ